MINNVDNIVTDNIGQMEWILKEFAKEAIELVEAKKADKLADSMVNLCTYIRNNKCRIDYKTFKEKEYYIGSGAIESANKTVIQQRMKQSGMR